MSLVTIEESDLRELISLASFAVGEMEWDLIHDRDYRSGPDRDEQLSSIAMGEAVIGRANQCLRGQSSAGDAVAYGEVGPIADHLQADNLGIPLSCGKPLCSPGEHHRLCRLHMPRARSAAQPGDDDEMILGLKVIAQTALYSPFAGSPRARNRDLVLKACERLIALTAVQRGASDAALSGGVQ